MELAFKAWVRQYKLDFDALTSDYSNEFDSRAVPTPADFVTYLKMVSSRLSSGVGVTDYLTP